MTDSTRPPEGDSPEARNQRVRRRWEANQERAARDAAELRATNVNGAIKPAADADKIAQELGERARRIERQKQNLATTDARIERLKRQLESAPPRDKPALERELKELQEDRDNAREILVTAEESLIEAQGREQHAKREAGRVVEDVLSRIDTAARAFDDALGAASEALRTIKAEAASIEVLGISIGGYADRRAITSALLASGLGDALGLSPERQAKRLEQSLQMYSSNARARRAELRKSKE